jgi:hypothetical protein
LTPTSQHPLHTRSRYVAKSSPAERIYRQPGERLGLSENLPSQTDESGKPTAESRDGEPVAANGHSPLNTCDFPNAEHLKPKTSGEAETEPIGTTSNHPFWSVDRQEFVQAGSLEIGERLQTLSGDVKVVQQKLPRRGPLPVFNLEVHNEHVYFVGEDGVLVHNNCGLSAVAAAGHANWANNLDAVNDTMARLGRRALQQGEGNSDLAEDILTKHAGMMNSRLRRTGSNLTAVREVAAFNGSGGTRAWNYLYSKFSGGHAFAKLGSPEGTSRLDLAIVRGSNFRKGEILAGIHMSYNSSKHFKLQKYSEAFGRIPTADIRWTMDRHDPLDFTRWWYRPNSSYTGYLGNR